MPIVEKDLIIYPSVQTKQSDIDNIIPNEIIPIPAREFYHDFGPLIHEKTGKPVDELTDYQYRIWDDQSKYRMVIKSQKVGLSTSCLLEDFQKAVTTSRGKDILVIAQSQQHANEHLHTLKRLIYSSPKYRKYLITSSDELTFKEEKTKLSQIFIKNPESRDKQTRIIAVGASEGLIWSWKHVSHIHMSDIAANDMKDDSPVFAAAFSRLLSTDGSMIIETPPRGPFKKTFEIYQQSLMHEREQDRPMTLFSIHHVSAQDGVDAGVITQATLDAERERLGPTLYAQSYECEFTALRGNLFNQSAIDKCVVDYDLADYKPHSEKYILADLGFVTSRFAILVLEFIPGIKKIRVLLAEEISTPTFDQMIERILVYRKRFGNVQNIGVDATSKFEFALALKQRIGESYSTPFIKERMEMCKKQGIDIAKVMTIVPFLFSTESKNLMTSHARRIIEDPRQLLQIHPSFIALITSLRSAIFDERGMLDKELTPHADILDAFFMGMQFFHFNS